MHFKQQQQQNQTKPTKKNTPEKNNPQTPTQKPCKIIPNEKWKMPFILFQGEMEKVNTSNRKTKEMNEIEIVNDNKGLIRDKAVDGSKRVKLKQWSDQKRTSFKALVSKEI